jgi:hypothetical protein
VLLWGAVPSGVGAAALAANKGVGASRHAPCALVTSSAVLLRSRCVPSGQVVGVVVALCCCGVVVPLPSSSKRCGVVGGVGRGCRSAVRSMQHAVAVPRPVACHCHNRPGHSSASYHPRRRRPRPTGGRRGLRTHQLLIILVVHLTWANNRKELLLIMPCNKDASRLAFADRSRERTANGLRPAGVLHAQILSFSKFFLVHTGLGGLGAAFFCMDSAMQPQGARIC